MRKQYFLLWLLTAIFTITSYAQTPIISNVVDACGNSGKFVEIYASGTVDFSDYKLVRRSNAGTWEDNGVDIDLSTFGERTDEFIYLIRDLATMNAEFPSAGISDGNSVVDGGISHNGDDSYRLVQITGDVVIDQFGGDIDGSGEAWEYVDSWGSRNNGEGPNPVFTIEEWTFNAINALDDVGICNSATPLEDTVDTVGSYEVATTSGPTTSAPVPTEDEANVVSLYSDAYTDVAVANYDPNWGQPGHTLVNTTFDPTGEGTDFVLAYPNFTYQGTDIGSNLDLSDMDFLHVDIWVADGTDRMVKVSPINNGTGPGEILVEVPVTPGSWNSVTLAKADFTDMTWDSVFQLKFDGQFNADGTANTTPFDIYVDNIYFSQEPASSDCGFAGTFDYQDNADVSSLQSFSVDTPGDFITLNFTAGSTESCCDEWLIFDNLDGSGTPIASGFGSIVGEYISTTGEISFYVDSDGSVTGTTFEFNVVCSAPPSCFAPENLTASNETINSIELSWDAVANVADTDAYSWFVFEAGQNPETDTPVADGSTNDTSFVVEALASGTAYQAYVQSNCGVDDGLSELSDAISFSTIPDYCAGDLFYDNGGPDANYANDSNETITIAPDNEGDVVTVTFLSFNTEQNYDGLMIYDGPDATSPLISSGFENPGFGPLTAGTWTGDPTQSFTADGQTFVSTHPSGALTFVFTSDGSATRAGWEASVVCGPPPSCDAPDNLTVSDITANEVNLSWDPVENVADTDGYTWFVFQADQDPETDTPIATGTTDELTATATGLAGNTDYLAYVSTNCGAEGTSNLSSDVSFTTDCDAFVAPFVENFDDNGTSLPDCWTQTSTDGQWQVNTSPTFGNNYGDNTTGSGSFAFVDGSTFNGAANDITLNTPFVDVSGLTSPALTFFVYHFKSQNPTDNSITVEVWDGAEWNQVYFDDQANFEGWEEVIIDLSPLTITGNVQARFIVDNTPNNFYNDIAIDDVSFDEGPSCFPVTSLSVDTITGTSADFSWEGNLGAVNGYEWVIVEEEVGDVNDDTTWIDSGSTDAATTVATSGLLSPETTYELYVRSNCDAEGFSQYNAVSFTTTVLCPEASDLTLTGVTSSEANFSWSLAVSETGGYEYVVLPDGLDPVADFDDNVANGTTAAGQTTQVVSGLVGNTDYEFHLRAVCDSGELSEFISVSFTTDCESAILNYEEDFTGLTTNVNTSLDCWTEGTGIFDTVGAGGWGGQNFNNDTPAGPFGTSMYINLWVSGTGSSLDWVKSQSIDLGAGSPDNIMSYDVYVRPWTINADNPIPVTDMGSHSVQVVISEDGGLTWDLANTLVTYDSANIPNDLDDTQEVISLADYSGVVQLGFLATRETNTPDLRFYIDNLFVGVPPTCDPPTDLAVTTIDETTAELSWNAVDNAADTDAYTWYVFEAGQDPLTDTPVATGSTGETSVVVADLEFEVAYQAYVETNCGDDGESDLSDAVDFLIGYCIPVSNNNLTQDYIALFETSNALQDVSISASALVPDAYRNLSDTETIQAFAGQEVDFELTYQDTFGSTQMQIWVDWNTNLTFDDDESLFQLHSDSNVKTGTITVPADVANGTYRFRVRAEWTTTDTGGPTACDDVTYGDTIDLSIEVTDEPDPEFANVQVIHNSPDPAAASVDVYLNGALLPELTGVSFREASAFLEAPANVDIAVDIVPAGADISESVFNQTFNLEADENYIIVANGVLNTADFETDNAFELSVYAGAKTAADDATGVDVIVHHGSPDAPAVDVNEPDAGNLVSNIAYPEFDGYLALPVADYVLEIAAAGNPDALVAYQAPLATLGGFEGAAITVVASGFFGNDAGDDNFFGLWVATAAGGPLVELPLVETEPQSTNVQVIHNSPDPAAATVDVYLNGVPSLLMGVDFRTASPFVPAPAGEDFTIDVVPVGGDISESVFTATLNLDADLNYIIVANGVLNPADFETDNAFELSVYAGARTEAESGTGVDILVHHGSPDAPAVDVNEVSAGNLVSNITYPEFDGYLELPVADYVLEIAAAGNTEALAAYQAPLATLGGFEGTAITIVASGFLGDDAGEDNGFGLWVATAAGGPLLELPLVTTATIDFDSTNFSYYPNPVSNELRIDARNVVEQVEVFNMLGQRVISQRPNQTNPTLNMSNFEAGVYLMKVSINGSDKTFQIIKN